MFVSASVELDLSNSTIHLLFSDVDSVDFNVVSTSQKWWFELQFTVLSTDVKIKMVLKQTDAFQCDVYNASENSWIYGRTIVFNEYALV